MSADAGPSPHPETQAAGRELGVVVVVVVAAALQASGHTGCMCLHSTKYLSTDRPLDPNQILYVPGGVARGRASVMVDYLGT